MPSFRAKLPIVQAQEVGRLLSDVRLNWFALPKWVQEAYETKKLVFLADAIHIPKERTFILASPGDYIVNEGNGHLRAMKAIEFNNLYEPVTD